MNCSSSGSPLNPARIAVMSAAAAALAPLLAGIASAQSLPIYGGPTYDQAAGNGYQNASFSGAIGNPVSSTGLAVGYANLYAAGVDKLARGVLLTAGASAIPLTGLTTDLSLDAVSQAYTINAAGQSVGYANKQLGGSDLGNRAVRWDAAGNVLELGTLGLDGAGVTNSVAYGINSAGQSVGTAEKYVGGSFQGEYAVRWDAASGTATELGTIVSSQVSGVAYAINSSSQAAGQMSKYDGNQYKGERAVRWNAAGAALELANLGLTNQNYTDSFAYSINSSGQIAGYSAKYAGGLKGDRAVRWDSATGAVTELANLGLDGTSTTYSYAFAINDAGQAAGRSFKYVGGASQGERAVRWNADGSALELADLGLSGASSTSASAFSINALGETAGRSKKYVGGVDQGDRAVYWTAAGAIVDLNTLIDPASNWLLTRARAISDNGWITGYGQYDPDGAGGVAAYQRHFLLNIATENRWTNALGGTWQTGGNWFTNFAPGSAVDAMFNLGSTYTVTLGGAANAKDLVVRSGNLTLALAGNALNVSSITVGRDSGDVAHLTADAGTVTLAAALNIATATGTAGTFTLNGGTLNAPTIVNKGTFHYNGGTLNTTTLQLSGVGLMKLSSGGDKALKLTTVSIADTSKLDLGDNKLIVSGGDVGSWAGSAYTGVAGLVDSGRGNSANAQWDGSGIVTSDTRAVNNNDLCSIGVVDASDKFNMAETATALFGGQAVTGADVLVMFTWGGDANLDGKINIDDYGQIDFNVASSGSVFGWYNGDFNYDGNINIDDYGIIDFNLMSQTGTFPTGGGIDGVAAVPEPAQLCALALALPLLLKRGRRTR